MKRIKTLKENLILKNIFILCLFVPFLFLGCSRGEKTESIYEILSLQDFSHGQVGKYSAKVYIKEGLTEEIIKEIIKDVTLKVRRDNNADVVWILVYKSKIPTLDTLTATTQWINKNLKKELWPYLEKSPVFITLEDKSLIYIRFYPQKSSEKTKEQQ